MNETAAIQPRRKKAALFVDIDGVFHPVADRQFEYVGSGLAIVDSPALFRWAPLLWTIIEQAHVDIVVHSSWRHLYSEGEIRMRFPADMRHRVAGVTVGHDRYRSILEYVEARGVECFAVLDDQPGSFPPGWPPLIVCDSERGISDTAVQERIRRFVEPR